MNLTTDAWIPTVRRDGKPEMVSLLDAFDRGHELQDLAVRPHERIALMRLLICVAQAALDGPTDFDDWKACRSRIAPAALEYLKHWQHAFEMFGDGQRFLQVANLKKAAGKSDEADEEGNSTSKLDLALATGNNATLFDNAGGSARLFQPSDLAVMLLTFQCFSPCGRIGMALWDGIETPGQGSCDHAPCLAGGMLHTLLRGGSLLDSVHRNLMSKSQAEHFFGKNLWGKPIWQAMPERPADSEAVHNATGTYLGRLVPLARAIRLGDDCLSLLLANGLEYTPYSKGGCREPTATIVVRKVKDQPERVVLSGSLDRGLWRELHSLTVKGASQSTPGGPPALQNVSGEKELDLGVGSLVDDKAKPLDTTESVFHVPSAMLTDASQRIYEDGVKHADNVAFLVKRAVSVCHKELGDDLDRREMRDRRQRIQEKATSQFWTDIEQEVSRLLEVVAAPESLGLHAEWHWTPWGQCVGRAAHAAYESACPRETPRQIRAYVLGRRALFAAPVEEPAARTRKGAKA